MIGFNVRADSAAREAITETGIDVRYYSIIYETIDDVKVAASGLLKPEIREQILGLAEVREVFRSPKFGNVAGCMVIDGHVKATRSIRVLRENVVIYEGDLESLRRFKDDVGEVLGKHITKPTDKKQEKQEKQEEKHQVMSKNKCVFLFFD